MKKTKKLTRSFQATSWISLMSALLCFAYTLASFANQTDRENPFDVPLDSLEPASSPSLYFKAGVRVNAYSTSIPISSEDVGFDSAKQRFTCLLWTEASPSDREIQPGTVLKITKASRTILKENVLGVKAQNITLVVDSTDTEFKYLGLNCDMQHNRILRKNQGRDFSVGVFNLALQPIEIILQ